MECIKRSKWFRNTARMVSCLLYLMFIPTKNTFAGIITSHNLNYNYQRTSDIEKIQVFLEKKIVQQRLIDYGVSPILAVTKAHNMSDKDLHLLASMVDRIPEGEAQTDYSGLNDIVTLAVIGTIVLVVGIVWIIVQIVKGIKNSPSIDNTSEIVQNSN